MHLYSQPQYWPIGSLIEVDGFDGRRPWPGSPDPPKLSKPVLSPSPEATAFGVLSGDERQDRAKDGRIAELQNWQVTPDMPLRG